MPIKSWAFVHDGHPIRAEIWWRFTGWNRKRVYVDHRLAVGKRGRFTMSRPVTVELEDATNSKQMMEIRFRPKRCCFDMDCELGVNRASPMPVKSAHIDKRWQAHGKEQYESQLERALGSLFVFVILLILLAAGLLYPLLIMLGGAVWWYGDRQLRRRMRKAGRYLSWAEIENRMLASTSSCTLIAPIGNLTPLRAWWTEEDVAARTPLPLPDRAELFHPSRPVHPFIEWCDFRYFSEDSGKAYLTELQPDLIARLHMFDDDGSCNLQRQNEFPKLSIIHTGYSYGERKESAARLVKILGDDLSAALPELIAGSADRNPTIRRMCIESIELAGESAAMAVPALKEQLYLGSGAARYLVAQTLAGLGPTGQEVLREASKAGDPVISRAAGSALRMHEISEKNAEIPRTKRVAESSEAKKARKKKQRSATILSIAIICIVLMSVIASGWFFGTITTLAGFSVIALLSLGIWIWLHLRSFNKRIKLRAPGLALRGNGAPQATQE